MGSSGFLSTSSSKKKQDDIWIRVLHVLWRAGVELDLLSVWNQCWIDIFHCCCFFGEMTNLLSPYCVVLVPNGLWFVTRNWLKRKFIAGELKWLMNLLACFILWHCYYYYYCYFGGHAIFHIPVLFFSLWGQEFMQLRFIRYGRVFDIQYASELSKILIGLEFDFLCVFAWHEQSLSRSSAGYHSTFPEYHVALVL